MSCCCTNPLKFCEPLSTCVGSTFKPSEDLTAEIHGDYIMKLSFLSASVEITKNFQVENVLEFPIDGLNEDFEFTGEIIDPNGDVVSVPDADGNLFSCFQITTKPKVSL